MATISELLVPTVAREKLGRRGISADDAKAVPYEPHVFSRNPRKHARRRVIVIGRDRGGRVITLVVEPTVEPGTWTVVTGWEATQRERRILRRR
jgi:uncharacterized DUF497 family protein